MPVEFVKLTREMYSLYPSGTCYPSWYTGLPFSTEIVSYVMNLGHLLTEKGTLGPKVKGMGSHGVA